MADRPHCTSQLNASSFVAASSGLGDLSVPQPTFGSSWWPLAGVIAPHLKSQPTRSLRSSSADWASVEGMERVQTRAKSGFVMKEIEGSRKGEETLEERRRGVWEFHIQIWLNLISLGSMFTVKIAELLRFKLNDSNLNQP